MTDNKYRQYIDETEDEFIYRVCSDKDIIGTWKDVEKILNEALGHEYDESCYRKKFQSFTKMLEANKKKFVESQDWYLELEEERRRLEKERKKLQTQKIEYNKWLREDAREELVVESIIDAISNLEPLEIPTEIKPVYSNKSYLLALADCHFGIEFKIKDLFGNTINEYSPEIFEERMWNLLDQVIEVVKKEEINELSVWELGDGIQGLLRLTSQLMQLRYGVIDSAIIYGHFMGTWLNELSKYVRVKFQMTMDSNHNQLRLCGAPKNAFVDENMSKVIMLTIKEELKNNPNVIIIENPTGMNFGQFSTYQVLGIHGEVKNLPKALNDFSRTYDTPISYIIGAHKHHSDTKEIGINAEAIGIRSMIGVDPYGLSLNATSRAGASLLTFDQFKGLVDDRRLIVD